MYEVKFFYAKIKILNKSSAVADMGDMPEQWAERWAREAAVPLSVRGRWVPI